MMLYPSVQELTSKTVNRYALVIAAAKGARHVTDEMQRVHSKIEERRESDRINSRDLKSEALAESLSEKPVSISIKRIYDGEYKIKMPSYSNEDDSGDYDEPSEYSDVDYEDQ